MVIQLKVRKPDGNEIRLINLCDYEKQIKRMTVSEMKTKIAEQLRISGDFRVIFRTDKLEDKGLVASYGITHMSTISTVLYLGGGSDSGPNKTLNCPPNPSNDNN